MKSRYQGLRGFGTLALVIAWILLILGILAGIGSWLGMNALTAALDVSNAGWSIFTALPGLLFGFLGFIQFYIIGKVLHLLVDLDNTTLNVQEKVQSQAGPAASVDAGAEISGELKRQAKLIASNLEATQSLQQQIGSLQARTGSLTSPAAPAAAVVTVVEETASSAAE